MVLLRVMLTVEAWLMKFQGKARSILAKNLVAFCSCPNNLAEAKFKSSGFISFKEEI